MPFETVAQDFRRQSLEDENELCFRLVLWPAIKPLRWAEQAADGLQDQGLIPAFDTDHAFNP